MKTLFRWCFRLFLVLVVLVVALLLTKDVLFKAWAEWLLRRETGMTVTISKLEVGLLSPTFHMEGFKMHNPPEFGGGLFLHMPELHLEYSVQEAASSRLRLNLLRLSLQELNIVRNREGRTNVMVLMERTSSSKGKGGTKSSSGPKMDFGGIDRLYLALGTVRYVDMQQSRRSWERKLDWKGERENLRTAEDVNNYASSVLLQILVREALRGSLKP